MKSYLKAFSQPPKLNKIPSLAGATAAPLRHLSGFFYFFLLLPFLSLPFFSSLSQDTHNLPLQVTTYPPVHSISKYGLPSSFATRLRQLGSWEVSSPPSSLKMENCPPRSCLAPLVFKSSKKNRELKREGLQYYIFIVWYLYM